LVRLVCLPQPRMEPNVLPVMVRSLRRSSHRGSVCGIAAIWSSFSNGILPCRARYL